MSTMTQFLGSDSLALPLAERSLAGICGVIGLFEGTAVDSSGFVSCHFSPTHCPHPSLAPPGERGGLHVAACLKAGTLRFPARWPQSECNTATGRCNQIRRRINWPVLDFSVCRPDTARSEQALPQRQLASTSLQLIEGRLDQRLSQLDGNAPLRTFFPPSNTRPYVAVSSLSAPAGVERVGVRGGIQSLKDKNAADNRLENSNNVFNYLQNNSQKQEHVMQMERGLEAKKPQNMMATVQLVAASQESTR